MLGTVVCDALMRHCLSDELNALMLYVIQCQHTFIDTAEARRSNRELLFGGLARLLLTAVRAGGDALLRR